MEKYNLIFDGDSVFCSSNDFYEFRYDLENFLEVNTHFDVKTLRNFDFETLENIITDILHGEIIFKEVL